MTSSKAQTLKFLENKLTKGKVLPLLIFKSVDDIDQIIKETKAFFDSKIIIRSSSSNEDTALFSRAGYYESVLDIDSQNSEEVKQAIQQVIDSFRENVTSKDEILIQPMLKNVFCSGVVFTSDLDTLSSYYIVNYDSSGSTTNVTDGKGQNLKTYIEYKYKKDIQREELFLDLLIEVVREIEVVLNNEFLDIEFGYDGKEIYVFQARHIVKVNKNDLSRINLEKALYKLYKKVQKLNFPHPNLLGDYTMFGVMPDWNPAEIIGKKPKPLSLSLYKELITDSVWAYQRNNYGYRNLRSHPLLVSFLGVAYIDIRVSFNSFIPKHLDSKIANKLVNYYLDTLKQNPSRHDKVEFDVIISCLDFSTKDRLKKLQSLNFSKEEVQSIEKHLRKLTNDIFDIYTKDLEKVKLLETKYDEIINSKLSTVDKIYWLNEYCKRYGTLPFAGLARAAFVAMSFLNSFVEKNILTNTEYTSFLNSMNTISKKMNQDYNVLKQDEFLNTYGHLRPGTYEITSKRYDKSFDTYFSTQGINREVNEEFIFSQEQLNRIEQYIKKLKLEITAAELLQFIVQSIEAREYSKFVFTKSLSQILVLIEKLGKRHRISIEDLSYLDFNVITNLYSSLDFKDISTFFKDEIEKNKKEYMVTQGIKLPDLIKKEEEVYQFFNLENHANYITLNCVESGIINEAMIYKEECNNKIVCIKSADPGYDFLFTKNISGLITCYGGANSHMAIRCAELNIPAVIGIGEVEYNDIQQYNYIQLDCKTQKVKKIR